MGKIEIKGLIVIIVLGLTVSSVFIFLSWMIFLSETFGGKKETVVIENEEKPKKPLKNSPFYYLGIFKKIPLSTDRNISIINHAVFSGLGVAVVDDNDNFVTWLPGSELRYRKEGELEYAGEVFDWWLYEDLDNDGKKELAIQFGIAGTAMVHPSYLYSYDGNNFALLLKLFESSSNTEIRDLNEDGVKEIIHDYSIFGIGKLERDLLRWKDIWRLENGIPIKVNHQFPQEYQSLIDLYNLALNKKEWEPDAKSYYPIIRCLKQKAELIIQGKSTNIDNCRELLSKRYE